MEFILNWIYPFQAISSKYTFSGRKAPLPVAKHRQLFRLELPFQEISSNFGFSW